LSTIVCHHRKKTIILGEKYPVIIARVAASFRVMLIGGT